MAREASAFAEIVQWMGQSVLVSVWYWQTRVVPSYAQARHSARLFCRCIVIGRGTTCGAEVKFRKALEIRPSRVIEGVHETSDNFVAFSERKMLWLNFTQHPCTHVLYSSKYLQVFIVDYMFRPPQVILYHLPVINCYSS
jgi:hypothetical protein